MTGSTFGLRVYDFTLVFGSFSVSSMTSFRLFGFFSSIIMVLSLAFRSSLRLDSFVRVDSILFAHFVGF
jgi:hypothetical protein